ncbi:ABC transporter permease [Micromonospora citrea]|uniref:ABC transporter permease n=1 Tax=Micromonospora citrea TaxID=47855 RepID=UPI001FE1879B|nr:ABC transporter permease [Micromonospora citrea]
MTRRRVQTVVIGLATMMAVTASVLGGSLVAASSGPFDRAFAQQDGAHLTAQFDADETTAARLTASARADGVAASAGPFPTVTATPRSTADVDLPPLTVVGRATPDGDVDRVPLSQGRWVSGPGQIVLSADHPAAASPLNTVLRFPDLPGQPTLTVVGVARSVSRTADAWVSPSDVTTLTGPGAAGGYQMLYRFAEADTAAHVDRGRAAVVALVGPRALVGAQSWLTVKDANERETALFVPFLVAFGALGLVMSVLVVGTVIAGAVGTATRRIGILKAVGFTPAQVVRAYVAQALVPAGVGVAAGVVAGNLLAIPVLADADQLYGTTDTGVTWWVDAVVVVGALGMVALTAWAAALRAGRLRTVDAIAVGRTPRPGRGQWAARLTARLPLPRPVSLGLAHPFARPGRAAAVLAAITFGATTVTFAVGAAASLDRVQTAKDHAAADVVIDTFAPPPGTAPAPNAAPRALSADEAATITAAIEAQPGTGGYYSVATTQVAVAGTTGFARLDAFTGDASWGGYEIVSGRWFARPGEAAVPSTFLTATGTRIGDSVVVTDRGRAVSVRIVGEVFHPTNNLLMFADAATFAATKPNLTAASYHIRLADGADVTGYVAGLNETLATSGFTAAPQGPTDSSGTIVLLDALAALLTLMLVAVAAMGVLNMVVLDTRERVRDLGIHKALGMTPRQTVAMVVASVAVTGLAGGAIGVAVGVAVHRAVIPAMGHRAGVNLPASVTDVHQPTTLLLLGLGGLLIAVAGALLPAGWAARTRTAVALRTE